LKVTETTPTVSKAGARWPGHLEYLGFCPVCSSPERSVLYDKLRDQVFFCAQGLWTLWQCLACECLYLDPRPSLQSIGLAYSSYFTHDPDPKAGKGSLVNSLKMGIRNGYYKKVYGFQEDPFYNAGYWICALLPPIKTKLDRRIRDLKPLPSGGGRLLDIGCGNGDFLHMAMNCGWLAEGIDPDSTAVATARRRGLNVRKECVEELDYGDEQFDVITMSHVLEHLHNPVQVLKMCHRMLKPGGALWISTPNVRSLGHGRFGKAWRGLEPPRHLVMFHGKALHDALKSAGFDRINRLQFPLSYTWMANMSLQIQKTVRPLEIFEPSFMQRVNNCWHELIQLFFPVSTEELVAISVK